MGDIFAARFGKHSLPQNLGCLLHIGSLAFIIIYFSLDVLFIIPYFLFIFIYLKICFDAVKGRVKGWRPKCDLPKATPELTILGLLLTKRVSHFPA